MMNVVDPSPSSETAPARIAVPEHDLRGVVAEEAGDEADERVEQADVDHDAEEHDREHQQRRGRGEVADRLDDHVAEPEAGAREQSEDRRHEDEGDHRRQAPGHDEHHEGQDHGESEDDEHIDSFVWTVRPSEADAARRSRRGG